MLEFLRDKLYLNFMGMYMMVKETVLDRHKTLGAAELSPAQDKTIVITGGNRGIGYEAVKKFLELNYFVVIGCRKVQQTVEKLEEYVKESGSSGTFIVLELDLLKTDSVRQFAEEVRVRVPVINVLINNAGIMFGPRLETEEGFESQFLTNYLSHFLLVSLLLDRIHGRIVSISSVAHHVAYYSTDWEDLQKAKKYTPEGSYGTSKAAQIIFTKCLQSKINDSVAYKDKVSVIALHPGVILTGLYEHRVWVRALGFLIRRLTKTAFQGGESIVYASISPELQGFGGLYLENSQVVSSSSFTQDIVNQKILWDKSLEMLNLTKFAVGLD